MPKWTNLLSKPIDTSSCIKLEVSFLLEFNTMSEVLRVNRKTHDADIVRLNSVGMSLATIAKTLGCHPTTITARLHSLKVPPADTRRSFMEDVLISLTNSQQEWLADQLGPHSNIKDFVKSAIVDRYLKSTT